MKVAAMGMIVVVARRVERMRVQHTRRQVA
jgi:hypothetical protein